ncbi:MAG: class I SAM-dependent methyltransferase [Reichenbachiella sp.]
MYERIDKCPTCNSKEFINHIICDDHSVSKESFAITKCSNCDLLLTNPRPDQASIGKYYQSEDYISHTNQANNIVNRIYKVVRNITLKQKYNWLKAYKTKESILDYGCGTGHFLNFLNGKGWSTTGIEPDSQAREIAASINDSKIYPNIDSLPNGKYGIITLWHVLEHVHDVSALLTKLKNHLTKKEGKLIIAVPNHNSYDRKFYKEKWAAYDVPRHLYHFEKATLIELLKQHGFKLIDIKPMKYDAYYVSMLSEKIKSGKSKFIKSFFIGLLSNRSARKNDNNYSSLTYIFQKV